MLAAQPTAVQFGLFEDGTPDTQSIAVRNMVPIPPSYVHLVLDRALNPQALWEQVGGAVINDGHELEVQGVAELAALRANTTKGGTPLAHSRRYHRDHRSGQLVQLSQRYASTHRSRITGGMCYVRTYRRWTRHAWPRLTKWCTRSRQPHT